jgi:hypothetical protein
MKTLTLCCAYIGLALLIPSCGLSVLGPMDKPKLVSEKWNQIDVTYWVFTVHGNQEVERKFTISDPSTITRLKSELHFQRTKGLSIGTGNQLAFKGMNGDIWHGSIVFEDTLHLSLSEDAWRSYVFTLKDSSFYSDLRAICVTNERKYHPKANSEHIKLRSNLEFDYPKL